MTPGAFLREMRESRGFSIGDVATLVERLGLARGSASPWYRWEVGRSIARIEQDALEPTHDQLLALAVLLGFNLVEYRGLARPVELEPAHV